MKSRRLNVLFIAIIALAAAPQALEDVHTLANALHERAETKFWSVFLSYQTPNAERPTSEYQPRRTTSASESCPFERAAKSFNIRIIKSTGRAIASLAQNASEKKRVIIVRENAPAPEDNVPVVENVTIASIFASRAIESSEKEKSALKAGALHVREKAAEMAARSSMASFVLPEGGNIQINMKQMSELNRLLRSKARNIRERNQDDAENIPEVKTEEGM